MAGIGAPRFFVQDDGAKLAYEVLGPQHIRRAQPLVLVGGLSSLRGDWERLALCLANDRPVLIFDHRGMGGSTLSESGNETISIESMARDLVSLIAFLEWKSVAICGFSMGGLVTQQLLFLPYLPVNSVSLPFSVTHVLLTGSLTGPLRDKRYGLKIAKPPAGRKLTWQEKRELARPMLESSFDPEWLADPTNTKRLDWWLNRVVQGRSNKIILMQARAVNSVSLDRYYTRLPRSIRVLVIHGIRDAVVPFTCAQDIIDRIPWAKMVDIGPNPGQVPSLDFGHHWWEYFDIGVWRGAINGFLDERVVNPSSRL